MKTAAARMLKTLISLSPFLLVGALPTGCGTPASTDTSTPSLYLNEIMAQNDTTIVDPDGHGGYPDWFEVYNAGTSSVDMSNMYLTDDLSNPTKWQVPEGVTIPAGGYLIFWADNDSRQGSTHTTFKLATAGGELGLFDTAQNGYAAIDTVQYGQQTADVSYGRLPNGTGAWQFLSTATPGQANK